MESVPAAYPFFGLNPLRGAVIISRFSRVRYSSEDETKSYFVRESEKTEGSSDCDPDVTSDSGSVKPSGEFCPQETIIKIIRSVEVIINVRYI